MFAIDESAVVSCYADAAALLVMLLLLIQSRSLRMRKEPVLRIFHKLCLALTVSCVLSFLCHAMYMQEAPWCHTLAIASKTLWKWFIFLVVFLWAAYVKMELAGSGKQSVLINLLHKLPFLVFTVLLVVNLFNGILFTCTEENLYEYTQLYHLFIAVEALYFLVSAFGIRMNQRRAAKICFIKAMPLLLPVVLGLAVQLFLPCEAEVLGFAAGAFFMYGSLADETLCRDEESGVYNKKLLDTLYSFAAAGKFDARSALILEMKGNLPAGYEILRGTVHRKGDVIRTEEGKFLLFSGTESRSALQLLSTQVEEAVEKQNGENPADKVQITVRCRLRTGEENTFDFLRSTVEEKDAGDPVQGVVSMISQLDRLDKELRLAADIQLSILPMNFPPFPDRKEFDLYASMSPAKEVGGDFYDFFLTDRDHLAMVIADVSGKGVPAALFMMVSKTLIKNQLMSGCDPAAALEHVNAQLYERNSSMMFVTVWAAVLEISTGRGTACNAGHEKPGIRRAGGNWELLKYKHGVIVGASSRAKYENREFELHPGDSVFVYTDGVSEATRNDNEMFGEKRLVDALNQEPDAEPQELIRRIREEVNRFADGAPQYDDTTMLCMKYYGSGDPG